MAKQPKPEPTDYDPLVAALTAEFIRLDRFVYEDPEDIAEPVFATSKLSRANYRAYAQTVKESTLPQTLTIAGLLKLETEAASMDELPAETEEDLLKLPHDASINLLTQLPSSWRLPDAQRVALQTYIRKGHLAVNDYLRHGLDTTGSRNLEKVTAMDEALLQSRLPADVSLYRSLQLPAGKELKHGTLLTDRGYVSTSLERDIAEYYANGLHHAGVTPVVLELLVPKDTSGLRGAVVDREVILPRGAQFKVVGLRVGTDAFGATYRLVTARYLGQVADRRELSLAKVVRQRRAKRATRFVWQPDDVELT